MIEHVVERKPHLLQRIVISLIKLLIVMVMVMMLEILKNLLVIAPKRQNVGVLVLPLSGSFYFFFSSCYFYS